MRIIILACIYILITASPTLARVTFQGIDITRFSPPEGWVEHPTEPDTWFAPDGVGYFEFAFLKKTKDNHQFGFVRQRGTAMVFDRTYKELVKLFGTEDLNNDYIPESAKRDLEYTGSLITLARAEIGRAWDVKKDSIRVVLSWREDGLRVVIFR